MRERLRKRRKYKRRLVAITRTTQRKLTAAAHEMTARLGFKVYPMQVAAVIVSDMVNYYKLPPVPR